MKSHALNGKAPLLACSLFILIFCLGARCVIAAVVITSDTFPGYITERGISLTEIQTFESTVKSIVSSLGLGWSETAIYSHLLAGYIAAAYPFPSADSFEKFAWGDIYFNPKQIIQQVEWVPKVFNADRAQYEARMKKDYPDFEIFSFSNSASAVNGRLETSPNSSIEYDPITYSSPIPTRTIIGFNLYNDAIEGPLLRKIRATGFPTAAPPFMLRDVETEFKMGMTTYTPIFQGNTTGTLTVQWTPDYFGCVVTVMVFRPLLISVLQDSKLENTDVFLFSIDNTTNHATYVGHYESEPQSTAPGLRPANVTDLQPENITGDAVTSFYGPLSSNYDINFVDNKFRVLVRIRKGSMARDVAIFNSSSSLTVYRPCEKMEECVVMEQGSTFILTVEDAQERMITFRVIGAKDWSTCLPPASFHCNMTVRGTGQGLQLLEVYAGNEQIPSSPIMVSVMARQCSAVRISDACLALATLVPSAFLAIAFLAAGLYFLRTVGIDKEHTLLLAEMVRLRAQLKLTRRNGFVLSSEWYPSWSSLCAAGGEAVVIQTKYLESAARLSLFRDDFEVKFFDSLCVCLNDKPTQQQIMRSWVLDLSNFLLDPIDSDELMRTPSNLKLMRTSSDGMLRRSLNPLRQGFRNSKINSLMPVFEDMWSPERRFQYFRSKVCKLRIWHDDDSILLKELKDVALALMNKIATQYDRRYEIFCMEPDGNVLTSMLYDIIPVSSVLGAVVNRQDHEKVLAIRVDEMSRREAELSNRTFPLRCMLQEEDIFLAQLWRRAKLLDDPFRQKVLRVIRKHKVTIEAGAQDPGSRRARRGSLRAEDTADEVVMTDCQFKEEVGVVELHAAPVKTVARMREKLLEYNVPESVWPLSANILDPVRVSIVCGGPSQIVQILRWFQQAEQETGLPVIRIKNKFASTGGNVQQGYRDLKIFVLYTDASNLGIIGEIQIHDRAFFDHKHKTHRLYKIARAQVLDVL